MSLDSIHSRDFHLPFDGCLSNVNEPSELGRVPNDLIVHIFSHLNLSDLGKCCCLSKHWQQRLKKQQIIWKTAIYHEIAFGYEKWKKYLGKEAVKDENPQLEFESLPLNIAEILNSPCPYFLDKRVKDSFLLVRIPQSFKGLTHLRELSNDLFEIHPLIVSKFGDQTIERSYWVLITKNILQNSHGRNYANQLREVDRPLKKSGIGHVVPTLFEAAVCIFAYTLHKGQKLFNCRDIRCRETIDNSQTSLMFEDFSIYMCYASSESGIAALRKLEELNVARITL